MSEYMNLTIAEKFLLLILKTSEATYKVNDVQRNAGVFVGILLDLQAEGRITIYKDKIEVSDANTQLSSAHQQVLELLANESKKRKLFTWFYKLYTRTKKYRLELLTGLEANGFVRIKHKKIWFIKFQEAYLIKENEQQKLLRNLQQAVNQRYLDDEHLPSLLVLIEMASLHKLLAKGRAQVKEVRKTFKNRFENDLFCKLLKKTYYQLVSSLSG